MSDIVFKWVFNRLGIVIDMTPDHFALKTSNGLLLAQLLQSYEMITAEELSLLKDSDVQKDCYANFSLINVWLRCINLTIHDEDLYEIVHGNGTTSLQLFYQVFLELKDKTKLDFLTEKELTSQLGKNVSRFHIRKVNESEDPNKLDLHSEGLCEPFLAGGDVYHWYKDRIETLQNRCKDARDEYIHSVKNRCKSFPIAYGTRAQESGYVLQRYLSPRPSVMMDTSADRYSLLNEDLDSVDARTYEDLVNKQKEAQELPPFNPDPAKVSAIMKHLHLKKKVRHENKLVRNKLHQEIMNEFERKINNNKAKSEEQVLINIFAKQSLYEKELITKLGHVKLQKEYMVENKFKQGEILNKLKEKDFMDALVLKDKELNEKKLAYYLEHERILILHKKIWEEKLRLRAKRNEEFCLKAVNDMVDISVKISEQKKRFGRELNKREMEDIKNLFATGQPIYDVCEPIIEIIKESDEDIPECIVTREITRQNSIDQEEFNRYMHYEWPWELKNINFTSEMFQQVGYGLNVLGYVVHNALRTKYPVILLWEKPPLPDAAIRVCVNGLNDMSILSSLRNLLSEREIKVIELSQAIDFCIESYRQESKREYDDEDTPVKEGKQKKEKPPKPKKGDKGNKTKKRKTEDNPDDTLMDPTTENKQVQTPIKYPCEEIPYTNQAMLGKTALELLDEGQPLGDFLIIDMFIEYLLSMPSINGWVLVNYPSTFEQAAILEEAFTGVKLVNPILETDTIKSLTDFAENEQTDEKDNCSLYFDLASKTNSRLLPDPVIVTQPTKVYDTVLTAYIRIRKMTCDDKTGEAILPPVFEELGDEPDPLDKFYSDAGANYSMYYKDFDLTTIKYLGKLIIGDYSLPLKSSVELFGDAGNLDNRMSKPVKLAKKGEKAKKPKERMPKELASDSSTKASTKVVAEKKDKKGKTKVIIVYEDKSVQVPTEDEEEVVEATKTDSITSDIIDAGHVGWEYSNVNCPEELMIALATLWETVETIYINDLKQIFFLKRFNMSSIMPFAQYVKDVMKKIIDRPDYKGFYMAKFQKAFNTFDMDFRQDDEFKMEMHCRIDDFKEKLTEMCDIKMMESETMRCRIIGADWAPSQITELLNNYINMLQIELDRFIESSRFINDYFLCVLIEQPSDEENYKEDLFHKYHEIDKEVVNNMFQDSTSTVDLSYFDELLTNMIQKAHNCIKRIHALATSSMEKTKGSQTANQKSKSKASSPKSKASKDTKKTMDAETSLIKDSYDKLVEEWQCAIKGETLRVTLRIDLIKYDALQSLEEFLSAIQQSFHEVYNQIRTKYREEIENINIACNVFQSAVENEMPVQKELLFDGHMFCINPETNLFDNPPIIPEFFTEVVQEGAFTMTQLSKLADIFRDLSPSGYMPKATFTFILQDIIWIIPEDGSEWLSPPLWRKLDSLSLRKVIDSLYDDLEYVYWRDFIIYNIRVDYPTERELLVTRKTLRECDPDRTEVIQDYQFFASKLWFEYEYKQEDSHRIEDIKRLLFKLYNIKNYGLNYTALLLDFCKDDRSLEGFAKALALSIGKLVGWDPAIGELFKEEYLRRMKEHEDDVRNRDAVRADHYKATYEEVSKLVDYVVHISEDVVIEDIETATDKSSQGGSKRGSILKKSLEQITTRRTSKGEEIKFKDVREIESRNADNIISKDSLGEELVSEEQSTETEDSQLVVKLYKDLPDNVGTESNESTEIIFFLPLDVLITVITAALPWHSRVQNFGDLSYWEKAAQVFDKCKNPDFNMAVLTHEFLNSETFLDLLSLTKKFSIIDPIEMVNNILNEIKI